jgi:hypothetical protein
MKPVEPSQEAKPAESTPVIVLPDVAAPPISRATVTAQVLPGEPGKALPALQVPDDPGPEPDQGPRPEIEQPAEKPNEGWGKIRSMFR